MKKSTAALATLVAAAGLAGGAGASAEAHPAQLTKHIAAHHTSKVAVTRLHALLSTPGSASERGIILPADGGGASGH
jgi:hypothetical protein